MFTLPMALRGMVSKICTWGGGRRGKKVRYGTKRGRHRLIAPAAWSGRQTHLEPRRDFVRRERLLAVLLQVLELEGVIDDDNWMRRRGGGEDKGHETNCGKDEISEQPDWTRTSMK